MLAALASAAMPSIVMAGVRDSERANDTDDAAGIDQAVMQDAAGGCMTYTHATPKTAASA